MAERQLHAIVLAVRDYGDAHRIVELLSREEGRVHALARNARASRRRYAGALDVFTGVLAHASPARQLWTLREATATNSRLGIRDSLAAIERASLLCQAVRSLLPEHQMAEDVYFSLTHALDALHAGDLVGAASFYPRLLAAAGVLPQVLSCAVCGARELSAAAVEVQQGGALCPRCAKGAPLLPRAVLNGLSGAACLDVDTAQKLESCALAIIAAETGRGLRAGAFALTAR